MPFAPGDISRVVKHMDGLAKEFSPKSMQTDMAKLGRVVAKEVDAAVRATPSAHGSLSDGSMSHWRRGAPIQISGRASPHRGDVGVTISPGRAAGPMRVLEDGRPAHAKGDRVLRRMVQTKTKGVQPRYRKVKRTAGATKGKGTWTRAVRAMTPVARSGVRKMFTDKVHRALKG